VIDVGQEKITSLLLQEAKLFPFFILPPKGILKSRRKAFLLKVSSASSS